MILLFVLFFLLPAQGVFAESKIFVKTAAVTKEIIVVKGVSLEVNKTSKEQSWRLVHDGVAVIALFGSTGYTWAKGQIKLFTTEEEARAGVKALGLKEEAITDGEEHKTVIKDIGLEEILIPTDIK